MGTNEDDGGYDVDIDEHINKVHGIELGYSQTVGCNALLHFFYFTWMFTLFFKCNFHQ